MNRVTDPVAAAASAAARTPLMRQYLARQAGVPRRVPVLPPGRFLRDVLRGRRARRAAARPHADVAQQAGSRADPDVRHSRGTSATATSRACCGSGTRSRSATSSRIPRRRKGIVQRGVTEVLTPGSVTGEAFLEAAAQQLPRRAVAAAGPARRLPRGRLDGRDEAGRVRRGPRRRRVLSRAARRGMAGCRAPVDGARAAPSGSTPLLAGAAAARAARRRRRASWTPRCPPRAGAAREADAHRRPAAGARAPPPAALDYLDRTQGGAALQMTRVERWSEDAAAALRRGHRAAPRAVRAAAGRRAAAHALASPESRA